MNLLFFKNKLLRFPWLMPFLLALLLWLFPPSSQTTRIALLTALLLGWLLLLFSWRRSRILFSLALLLGLAPGLVLLLPGRPIDPLQLQSQYVRGLKAYEGSLYVWGGENRIGIDCSGLVRRGLIDAYLHVGLDTLNPFAFRQALDLWWHDCTAKALLDGYRDLTVPVAEAPSINATTNLTLQPGDLAVTRPGIHVMACLGNHTWIEADPSVLRVIQVQLPTDNPWFTQPVKLIRWKALQSTPYW